MFAENHTMEPVLPDAPDLEGFTLRDYFAAQALSGLQVRHYSPRTIAEHVYSIADAMLEHREKPF